ncbi:MAG: hypothetical protein Q9210_001120 [Variospora velana]
MVLEVLQTTDIQQTAMYRTQIRYCGAGSLAVFPALLIFLDAGSDPVSTEDFRVIQSDNREGIARSQNAAKLLARTIYSPHRPFPQAYSGRSGNPFQHTESGFDQELRPPPKRRRLADKFAVQTDISTSTADLIDLLDSEAHNVSTRASLGQNPSLDSRHKTTTPRKEQTGSRPIGNIPTPSDSTTWRSTPSLFSPMRCRRPLNAHDYSTDDADDPSPFTCTAKRPVIQRTSSCDTPSIDAYDTDRADSEASRHSRRGEISPNDNAQYLYIENGVLKIMSERYASLKYNHKSEIFSTPDRPLLNTLDVDSINSKSKGRILKMSEQHAEMDDTHKFKLPSGAYAEDLMYRYRTKTHHATSTGVFESLCARWILDLEWARRVRIFSPDDLDYLFQHAVADLPDLPKDLALIFDQLEASDHSRLPSLLAALLKGALTSERPARSHGSGTRWDNENISLWLNHALTGWLLRVRSGQTTAGKSNAWCTNNLWSSTFDSLLQTIPGFVLHRRDPTPTASSERENRRKEHVNWGEKYRNSSNNNGRLVYDNGLEYLIIGATVESPQPQTADDVHEDYFNLAQSLQELMQSLHQARGTTATQPQLQLIGILEHGQQWQVYGLQQHGYVSCIREHANLRIPMQRNDLAEYIDVLRYTVRIYYLVKALHQGMRRKRARVTTTGERAVRDGDGDTPASIYERTKAADGSRWKKRKVGSGCE